MTLGVIAASAVEKVTSNVVISEDFRILKSRIIANIRGADAGTGAGSALVIANGELTAAEMGACLSANGPKDRNDRSKVEEAERHCHVVGDFVHMGDSVAGVELIFRPAEGYGVEDDKFRWTYSDPEGWAWGVYNYSAASFATGASLALHATHYGVWVT